jgi:hypothetical protein
MQLTMSTKNTFVTLAEVPEFIQRRTMSFPVIDLQMLPLVVDDTKRTDLSRSSDTCSTEASERDLTHTHKKTVPWRNLNEFAQKNARDQDNWTTVMIRKIPNRYSQEQLLEEIMATGYDINFLHLPLVSKSNANVGYAFANFETPEEAVKFMEHFDGHELAKQEGNVKHAEVNYARLQGFQENLAFFDNRRIASMSERKPWVNASARLRAQTM